MVKSPRFFLLLDSYNGAQASHKAPSSVAQNEAKRCQVAKVFSIFLATGSPSEARREKQHLRGCCSASHTGAQEQADVII